MTDSRACSESATHERVTGLIDVERAEVLERIRELQGFAEQLGEIRATLDASPPPAECLPDLSCCVPEAGDDLPRVPIALLPTRQLGG